MTDQPTRNQAADRALRAADALDEDASRPDRPTIVAERKRAAANDLRVYAEQVRAADRRYDSTEVDVMVTAGECSGIVIDGWRNVESQLQQSDAWTSPEVKQQIRDDYDRKRAALDQLVRDGRMVRVDDGDAHGQVPFYALASYGGGGGWTREEVDEARRRDEQGDEP